MYFYNNKQASAIFQRELYKQAHQEIDFLMIIENGER